MKHGETIFGGVGRYCAGHKIVHGYFYVCDLYPRELQDEVRRDEKRHLQTSASIALVLIFVVLLLLSAF